MSLQQIFDFLAVRLDGPAVVPLGHLFVDWVLPDVADTVRVELSNGTLHSLPGRTHASPDATVTGDRVALEDMIATGTPFAEVVESGAVTITGDVERVLGLFGNLTDFPLFWNVVEP
jgi:alkyl sulfatase BDS1-like metallo-beta-lactamase superfamily hydrolase